MLGSYTIYRDDNSPCFGGELGSWKTVGAIKLLDIIPVSDRCGLKRVTHFPGRGLLIPVAIFNKIGFYDEIKFPQGVADDDFTFRASYEEFEVYCNYDAKLYVYRDEIHYSLKNYLIHLFGKRGRGNIIYYTKFAIKHCPKKYLIWALIKGNIARIVGYPKAWLTLKIKK